MGIWKQYFDDGKLKLESFYVKNVRSGTFKTYYPNGMKETSGFFANNLMEDKWQYFDETGALKMTVDYRKGLPKDKAIADKKDKDFFELIDSNKGRFPEPKVTDLVPNKE